MTASFTWPDTSSLTLRLPLRAVVASSSAMRSSRSPQQSPPRSAAWEGMLVASINPPAARMVAHPALPTPPNILHNSHEGTPQLGLRSTHLHTHNAQLRDHTAQPFPPHTADGPRCGQTYP